MHASYIFATGTTSGACCGEKLSCGEIRPDDRLCTIYGVLLQSTIFCCKIIFLRFKLFCRKISFDTIYALLRGENLAKNCDRGEKITNMRYELEVLLLGPSRPPGHLEGPYWLLPSYFRHSGYCHLSCACVCRFSSDRFHQRDYPKVSRGDISVQCFLIKGVAGKTGRGGGIIVKNVWTKP